MTGLLVIPIALAVPFIAAYVFVFVAARKEQRARQTRRSTGGAP